MCTKTTTRRRSRYGIGEQSLRTLWSFFESKPPKTAMVIGQHKQQQLMRYRRTRVVLSVTFFLGCFLLALFNFGAIEKVSHMYVHSRKWDGLKKWDFSKGPWTVRRRTTASADGGEALPPLRIPRIVHQTFKSWSDVLREDKLNMEGWRAMNPTWEFRYYDNVACDNFVKENFPQYLHTYNTMPRKIERVDFFRYLVVLHSGGIYADTDVECRQPLDTWIDDDATFIAGVEHEFVSTAQASQRQYARKRQLLQWTFASAPNSPVLANVVANVHQLAKNETLHNMKEVYATYERTGPGMWTDAIYEAMNQLMTAGAPFDGIRILPRIALGPFPNNADGINAFTDQTYLLHHFRGSWKSKSDKEKYVKVPSQKTRAIAHPIAVRVVHSPPIFTTVFVDDMTVPHAYHGLQFDAVLTAFGQWQAGLPAMERPSVMEVITAALRKTISPIFVDVGARNGLFSVAQAQIGFDSVALVNTAVDLDLISRAASANAVDASIIHESTSVGGRLPSSSTMNMSRLTAMLVDGDGIGEIPDKIGGFIKSRSSRSVVTRIGGEMGAILLRNLIRGGAAKDIYIGKTAMVLVEIHGSSGIPVDEVLEYFQRSFKFVYHSGRACNQYWRESGLLLRGRHSKNYAEDPEESSQSKLGWFINKNSIPAWCAVHDNQKKQAKLREHVALLKPHRAENILFLKAPIEDLGLENLKVEE